MTIEAVVILRSGASPRKNLGHGWPAAIGRAPVAAGSPVRFTRFFAAAQNDDRGGCHSEERRQPDEESGPRLASGHRQSARCCWESSVITRFFAAAQNALRVILRSGASPTKNLGHGWPAAIGRAPVAAGSPV